MELMNCNPKRLIEINEIITECKKINPQIQVGVNANVLIGTQYIFVGHIPESIRNKLKGIGATFERC